jgi:hypothetical protein
MVRMAVVIADDLEAELVDGPLDPDVLQIVEPIAGLTMRELGVGHPPGVEHLAVFGAPDQHAADLVRVPLGGMGADVVEHATDDLQRGRYL